MLPRPFSRDVAFGLGQHLGQGLAGTVAQAGYHRGRLLPDGPEARAVAILRHALRIQREAGRIVHAEAPAPGSGRRAAAPSAQPLAVRGRLRHARRGHRQGHASATAGASPACARYPRQGLAPGLTLRTWPRRSGSSRRSRLTAQPHAIRGRRPAPGSGCRRRSTTPRARVFAAAADQPMRRRRSIPSIIQPPARPIVPRRGWNAPAGAGSRQALIP